MSIYIVNIYHTTESATGLARTSTQHSGKASAWQRVCAVRATGIVSKDPTCEDREWVARIEVVSVSAGYAVVWSEGEVPVFSDAQRDAYYDGLDAVLEAGLDEVEREIEAEQLAAAAEVVALTAGQDRQQQRIGRNHDDSGATGAADLNTMPDNAAAARRVLVPASEFEARRADAAAKRGEADEDDANDDVDIADLLAVLGMVEVAPSLWHVAGSKGRGYLVTALDGIATVCDCPDRTMRKRRCKHMKAVDRVPLVLAGANAAWDDGLSPHEIIAWARYTVEARGRDAALDVLCRVAMAGPVISREIKEVER